jgi:hypothetical protein
MPLRRMLLRGVRAARARKRLRARKLTPLAQTRIAHTT